MTWSRFRPPADWNLIIVLTLLTACAGNGDPLEEDIGAGNGGSSSGGASASSSGGASASSSGGASASSSGGNGSGIGGTQSGAGAASAGTGGASSASTGGDGSGGEPGNVSDAIPCPPGSVLEKVSTGSYFSWPGTVFSSIAPSGKGENHNPKRLEVQVTNGSDVAVSDCEVRFEADAGHGWGIPAEPTTNEQGELYGYWIAGQPGENTISAVIQLEGGGESRVDFTGTVTDHSSRTDSVHLNYQVESTYTELKVQITPVTEAPATYYSALNWRDSYAGIQFDGDRTLVLFSVWDAGGEKATIDSDGACNATVGFGGEGTGTSCRFVFPPNEHGAVAGLPDDYMLEVGHTYALHLVTADAGGGRTKNSLTFSDLTRGLGPISLGTQSTGTNFTGGGFASAFVEEWTPHGSCLSNTRAVYYHDIQYKVGGIWQDVTQATFSPNYVDTNNEICGNYLAEVVDGKFLVSSGGTEYIGRPYIPGDALFPKPQAALILP